MKTHVQHLLLAAALLAGATAHAADFQWNSGTGGTGTWTGSNPTLTNADKLIFGGTAGTVTLGSVMTVNALQFDTAGYTLTGNTITLAGTAPTITTNADATISSILAGAFGTTQPGLTFAGTGVLTLTGANTMGGYATIANGSTVRIASNGALGSTGASNITTVASGGTLQIGALDGTTSVSSAERLYIGGSGVGNGGAIRNISANNSLTANWYLTAATRINSDSGTLTMSGQFTQATGNSLTIGGAGNTSLTGANAGGASWALTKDGTGTLTLGSGFTMSATNASTVTGGTLLVNSASSGSVTVSNAGSILGGTGTVGAVTVNSGAILQGGLGAAASGTLTGNGNLTLNSGSIIQLALGTGGTHSTLARTGTGLWSFDANQQFSFIDLGATAGTTYTGILTGLAGDPTTTGSWTVTNPNWSGAFLYNSGTNAIDFRLDSTTPIPEPSTYGLMGAGALATVALIRRRRKVA